MGRVELALEVLAVNQNEMKAACGVHALPFRGTASGASPPLFQPSLLRQAIDSCYRKEIRTIPQSTQAVLTGESLLLRHFTPSRGGGGGETCPRREKTMIITSSYSSASDNRK